MNEELSARSVHCRNQEIENNAHCEIHPSECPPLGTEPRASASGGRICRSMDVPWDPRNFPITAATGVERASIGRTVVTVEFGEPEFSNGTQPGRTAPLRLGDGPQPGRTAPLLKMVDEWAEIIKQARALQTTGMIEFGRLIYSAKLCLKRGLWAQMFRQWRTLELPFGKTTAKKWAQIGEVCGAKGQEPDLLEKLPGTLEALYQLSRLGTDLLVTAFRDGTLRSALTEAEAKELVSYYRPELRRKPRPFDRNRWLAKLHQHLETLEMEGTLEDREAALPEARDALDLLFAETVAPISSEVKTWNTELESQSLSDETPFNSQTPKIL